VAWSSPGTAGARDGGAARATKGFIILGLGHLQFVNTWGFNAPGLHISALVASFAGAKCAGLYPTDLPEAAAYKVVHSQSAICDTPPARQASRRP